MSTKRSGSDALLRNPQPKRARYSYNAQLQQQHVQQQTDKGQHGAPNKCDEIQVHDLSNPIQPKSSSNVIIENKIIARSFDAVSWLEKRSYHGDGFFDLLGFGESDQVTQQLLEYQGASTTLIQNQLKNINLIHKLTNKFKQKSKLKKQKQKNLVSNISNHIDEIKEIFHPSTNDQNIKNIQNQIKIYNKMKNEKKQIESEQNSLWKFLPNTPNMNININANRHHNNNNNTNTPPPNSLTPNSTILYKDDYMMYDEEESEYPTSHLSDEDYILDDELNDNDDGGYCYKSNSKQKLKKNNKPKKKKIKKSKLKRGNADQVIQQIESSKSYTYVDSGNAPRFWKRFEPFFECLTRERLQELIPDIQHDITPVDIPSLPVKSDDDDINNDDDMYFAEMPKEYEYFTDDKKYFDEQYNLENIQNNKHLQSDPVHQNFPNESLMAHSMDQRILSAMVFNTNDEMWNFERDKKEFSTNDWKQIGKHTNFVAKQKKKKKKKKKRRKMTSSSEDDEDDDIIDPELIYQTSADRIRSTNDDDGPITFEQALRRNICDIFFDNDLSKMREIENMQWTEREDDECCATIRSWEDVLKNSVNKIAPNNMEQHIEITNKLISIAEQTEPISFAQQELNEHFDYMSKTPINGDTLNDPQMANYLDGVNDSLILDAVESLQVPFHVDEK